MRSASLVTIAGFLAGLGLGFFARPMAQGAPRQTDTHAADMAAIEKLHQADMAATLAQDPKSLTALWSDDGVNLGFPGPPVVGAKAMGEAYEKFRAERPDFQVLKYMPSIRDVRIVDEWALEVGDFGGTYKMTANGTPVTVQGKGMRLLKRQTDGSWKFALVGLK